MYRDKPRSSVRLPRRLWPSEVKTICEFVRYMISVGNQNWTHLLRLIAEPEDVVCCTELSAKTAYVSQSNIAFLSFTSPRCLLVHISIYVSHSRENSRAYFLMSMYQKQDYWTCESKNLCVRHFSFYTFKSNTNGKWTFHSLFISQGPIQLRRTRDLVCYW